MTCTCLPPTLAIACAAMLGAASGAVGLVNWHQLALDPSQGAVSRPALTMSRRSVSVVMTTMAIRNTPKNVMNGIHGGGDEALVAMPTSTRSAPTARAPRSKNARTMTGFTC